MTVLADATLSVASVYVCTAAVFVFALYAFLLSVLELRADRRELKVARRTGNPIFEWSAFWAYRRALCFVGITTGMVVIAVGGAIFIYQVPPQPDSSWLQVLFRLDYVFMCWCALMAKRTDRNRRRYAREHRDSEPEVS